MSSTVDDVSDISGGGLKQELLETAVQEDVLHTSTVLSTSIEVFSKLEEEQVLKSSTAHISEGAADSTTDSLVVVEKNNEILEDNNELPLPDKILTEPDSTGSPPQVQIKTSPLLEMPSLGPDLTITEINDDLKENDNKKTAEVSIFKVENPTINDSLVQDAMKSATAHINGMVAVSGKKSTNGSTDYTSSCCMPVITVNNDGEENDELTAVAGDRKQVTNNPEIPAMKWGIMNKKASSPHRQKKLPTLAPKPATTAAVSSPQQSLSPGGPPPSPPDLFLQLLRIPQPVVEKCTSPTSMSVPQQEDGKHKQLPQQQQRPTALVNPFPAQKLVRDGNASALVTICKGTQADGGGDTVTIPAIVLNSPVAAKNQQDAQDLDKKNVCMVPKVINRQHQRWTQTTLLDFHRIKNVTTTSASNIQPVSATATVPVQQQQQQQLVATTQQQQPQMRNKSVVSSTVGAAAMLTPVMTKLQAGGTVCVTGSSVGPNTVVGCLIQNKAEQDDASILHQLLATQQAAAASIAEQTGNSVAVLGGVDLQQHNLATTPAEMSVIDMLKRLGTVVELEEQKDPPQPAGDLVALTAAAPGAEQPVIVPNALALLENIKIDKPQSPVMKALEDTPAPPPTSQVNKHCSIPPIPTTTFYLGKDISVFPHVTPPVISHIPVAPAPIQPKRTTQISAKSATTQLSSAPTQPRLPPDVSVFATTRDGNNPADCKTVQQWSLNSLVKQVKGCLSSKQQQQQQHPILEEVNQLNAQRNRQNQQQRLNQLPKQQQQMQSQVQQVISGQQQKTSPKRKSSLTKEPAQYNHVALHHLEPEIDIVEGDNVLSSEGTFIFNMDSFFNVDLPNNDMIYSCDICSAVYQHPHRLKKHYLRLHIARKYIAKRDLDAFNIDSKSECNEEDSDIEKIAKGEENNSNDGEIKLVFRCHTCRKCVATKAELKSHLTDHPPVVDLKKQIVKGVKNYKCDYCSVFFKWKKMFLKHKKNCRLQPSIQGTTIPAPATPATTTPVVAPAKLQGDVDKPKKTIKSTTTAVVSSTNSKHTVVNTATTTSVSTAITTVTTSCVSTSVTATNPHDNTSTVAATTVLAVINSATATTSAVNTVPTLSTSNIPTTIVATSNNTSTTTVTSSSTYKSTKTALSKAASHGTITAIKAASTNTSASTKVGSTNTATAKAGSSTHTFKTTKTSSTTSAKTKAASTNTVTTKATSTKSTTATKTASANTSTAKLGSSSAISKANTSSAKATAAKTVTTSHTVKTAATGIVKTRRVRNSLKNVIRLLHHCLYCNETFHNGNSKRNHTLSNHPYVRKGHPCVFCQREFVSNNSLFTHLLEDHTTVYFACAVCKDRFTNLQELGGHNDRKHNLDEVEKSAFSKRISTIRQDKDCYTCQTCQRMFVIESSYKSHKCTPPEQQATPELIKRERNTSTTLNTSTTSNCSPNVSTSTNTTMSGSNNTSGNSTEKNDNKPVNKIRAKKSKYNEREVKTDVRVQPIDPEVAFFNQVSRNVRENLQNHLDGRLVQSGDDSGDDMGNSSITTEDTKKTLLKTPETGRRTRSPKILNRLSLGSPTFVGGGGTQPKGGIVGNNSLSRLSIGQDDKGVVSSSNQNHYSKPRASPWEKYAFPKEYDGRCGLTSYIKDISYLDISTQLIMRRNMQSLQDQDGELLDGEEWYLNGEKVDIPSVLALERMAAKCAESFSNDDSTLNGGDDPLNNDGISSAVGELSGEWVRERTYVCLVCGWETHCLWSMEDHKYDVHPSVVCPRLELVGDQRKLAKKIYTRLTNVPAPFILQSEKHHKAAQEIACTKCNSKGYATAHELHVHLLECAGEKVPEWIRNAVSGNGRSQTPRKRKWSRKRRRPRRGLKRNIPSTPQKPNKTRSKPGDTDTIQKMIANLPAKRLTRRVIAFDEKDLKTRSQSHIQNPPLQQQTAKSAANKTNGAKSKNNGHLAQQHDSTTPLGGAPGVMNAAGKLDCSSPKATSPSCTTPSSLKRTNSIDTSAEGGDVLSSLRMMPVSTPRPELLGTQQILDRVLGLSARVKEEEAALSSGIKCTGCGQAYESKTVLRRHHKSCAYFRECGPISQHPCQTCHKTFDNLVALIEHTCEEIPPRLEAEESMTSNTETVSSTAAQMDNKDIPVLSPALEGDNKVESKAKGEKANKSSSAAFGVVKEIIIPLVVKEENIEKSKIMPLSQTTAVQTVDHYRTYTNEVPMLPISSTSPAPAAPGGGAVSSYLNVPYHSIKTASLICGISFVDGFIKYETVNSVSKETEKILELSGTKKGDNLNKRGRPKRKSGEEASVALFHALNSGRRSNSSARAEKDESTKIRKTRKGVAGKSEMPDGKIVEQTGETIVSSNSHSKTSQRRGRGKTKVSSTIIHSAIQEPVVSSDLPEVEIKVKIETDDKEDKVKSENDDEEVTVTPVEESKIRRKRKWSTSPIKKEANVYSNTEDINNSQTISPNKSSDNVSLTGVVKRKRGRPFGSLSRKSNGLPERRSSRCRARNSTALDTIQTSTRLTKFEKSDGILLFDEEEDSVKGSVQKRVMSTDKSPSKQSTDLESQEKKKRNRWSSKQQPCRDNSPDTTTIVVQAEVHPEPSPRRIRKEFTSSGAPDEQLNLEEKPAEACRKTNLGRKKRIEQDQTQNLKSIKKLRTEVGIGITTSVDEISVLEVEEIVMENATPEEDDENTSHTEKLESPCIDENESIGLESSIDGVVNINDIKRDLKDESIEETGTNEESTELADTAKNENENLEMQVIEHSVQESHKSSVKKMKKKNKKKKKYITVGLQRSTSPQQSLPSVKKTRKISKDEKLKKNIKAAALSIARLKKKKKILQIKNDKRHNNKKEVVKVAGFSWEVSELAKSPEKSPATASTQLENNTVKSIDSTPSPADMKDGILQPQSVCFCSNRSSPIQQATAAFTATSSTRLLQMAQATDINPPTPATFHYTLTKEDWLSQTTAPLASSTVHPVHPVPIVHQLATSSVSQTLCTLQPAVFNHQHQQPAQNNITSLMEQVGTCQTTVAINQQQQQDVNASSAPVLHSPHIVSVPTTRQQTNGLNTTTTVGSKLSASATQPVHVVNSPQLTENSLVNVTQQSIGQPLFPQQLTSVSHTMAQTAVQATTIYTSPLQHIPLSSQLEFYPPTKTVSVTTVDQMVIPPPPSFQSSPPCHQLSMVQSQQQLQISSTTSKQIPASFQSSVNPSLSVSSVSSSGPQEIDIGPIAAVTLQSANSSPTVNPNIICTAPTSQLQCYPTTQSLTTVEETIKPVLLATLQSQQQSVVQNQQNFTSLQVISTHIAEQPTNLISTIPSVSLPSETAQLTSSDLQSSQTVTPVIKPTATIQDCTTPTSSNQLVMDQQLPPVSSSTLAPSLGTIIDSVNKLLNEPDLSTGGYSPLSHYSCMTDYCTEDDITVLQHLGEAAAVEIQDDMPDLKQNINTRLQLTAECETDCWSPGDSKSFMDLDNQPPQEQPPPVTVQQQDIVSNIASTSSNGYGITQENTNRSHLNLHLKEEINNLQGIRKRRASPALKLMDAYEGKEVVCPTCHSQFLGFSALQAHVEKAHNQHSSAQTSGNNSNSTVAQTGQVTSINRRVVLESCKGNRRVCHVCQQILPANLMMSHLSDEHALDHSSFLGDPNQDPACGERLKTKLATALGDLLDKAVHNLVLSKPKTESQLSAGAAELLSRLCAIRLKDSSFKQRLNPKDVQSKLKLEKTSDTEELLGAKLKELAKSYPCEFCGLKFFSLGSKKKHQKLEHRTMKTPDQIIDTYSDIDEYENDWRGVPSPNSSNNDGTGDTGDTFHPTCSECGLSFPTLIEMMRHRNEDHGRQGRRLSSDIGMPSSRPHTPSSVHNSNVSCGSGSGSATPNNINTVSNSSCLNNSTAVSLANTLSRLQQRTRSSSVETQSSCGGSSVTTTTSSSRGGRAGSKSRGGGNSGRTVTPSQLKIQQQQICQINPSGDDDGDDSSSSSKEIAKGKSRRSVNKKSNTSNPKKQQPTTTITGGGQQKCNNNSGGSSRSQRGGGRTARRGSLQNKTLSTSVEEAAKAEQALRQLTREKSGSNLLRNLNRSSNNTTTTTTTTTTSSSDTATLASAVAVTNNSNNNCQLPSLQQSNILS